MEAKLVKRSNGRFDLYSIEDKNQINTIASSFDNPIGKLSIKNCQSIERGYDLNELAYHNSLSYTWLETDERDKTLMSKYGVEGFKAGFQKAVELMGDKKFSEQDMINFSEFVSGKYINQYKFLRDKSLKGFFSTDKILKEYQSLQQTEWEVEIVAFTEDDLKSVSEDWSKLGKPKLDADGCLILKTFKSE